MTSEPLVLGIDIGKRGFHLAIKTFSGKLLSRKMAYRDSLLREVMKLPQGTRIAMEACSGAHFWGRLFKKHGYEVKLMAPNHVAPYRLEQHKNDMNDAAAIAEAALRPTMRFIEPKTVEQQELQQIHKVREQIIKTRTATGNQIHGMLLELGVTVQLSGRGRRRIPEILEKAVEEGLMTTRGKHLIETLLSYWQELDEQVDSYDDELKALAQEHPVSKRLMTIPGVGPTISTAILAAVTDPKLYANARQFAAWLGLVPKQHSTGGKARLMGITKHGNSYIRKILIHGARSVAVHAANRKDRKSTWINNLRGRCGWNKTIVAIANKTARIIWNILRFEKTYDPDYSTELPAGA